MTEANKPLVSGFMMGEKPIHATVYWSYKIVSNNGLPHCEIVWFLSMVHEITYELTGLVSSNKLETPR